MSICHWPVEGVRRCRTPGATRFFSDLALCPQHRRLFIEDLHGVLSEPDGWHEQAIQATAQEALSRLAAVEHAKREAVRRARSLVYFVQRDGFVKIGHSSDLKGRLRAISTGSCLIKGMTVGPVELLATIDGAGPDNERWLHRRFARLRIGGEWFLPDDELRAFIAGLKGFRGWPNLGEAS